MTIGPATITYGEAPLTNSNLVQMQNDYVQSLQSIQQERHVLERFVTDNPSVPGSMQDRTLAVYLIMNNLGCKFSTVHKHFDDVSKMLQNNGNFTTQFETKTSNPDLS